MYCQRDSFAYHSSKDLTYLLLLQMMKLHLFQSQAEYKTQLYARQSDEGDWMSTWEAEGKMALAPSLEVKAANMINKSHWLPMVSIAKSESFNKARTLHTDFLYWCVPLEINATSNFSPAAREAVSAGHHMCTYPTTGIRCFVHILSCALPWDRL